jgi:hypothetical protein
MADNNSSTAVDVAIAIATVASSIIPSGNPAEPIRDLIQTAGEVRVEQKNNDKKDD